MRFSRFRLLILACAAFALLDGPVGRETLARRATQTSAINAKRTASGGAVRTQNGTSRAARKNKKRRIPSVASAQGGRRTTAKKSDFRMSAKVLAPQHVAELLRETGFPDRAIPRLVCTAKYESAFHTRAKNRNRNGTHDTGLFQINDIWLESCGVTRKELLNPTVNAACALKVYREQGMDAWYAYKKKKVECRRYRLEEVRQIAQR